MNYVKTIIAFLLFTVFLPSFVKAGEYFNVSVIDEYFCVYITDPATLELAYRDARREIRRIVMGNLTKGDGGFNQPWSWHLKPDSVRLVEMAIELCDGRPSYVESNLMEWLKIGVYCPWVSDIIKIGCSSVTTITTSSTSTSTSTSTTSTSTSTSTTTTRPATTIPRGGCPTFFVYDGKEYVDVRKTNLHSQKGIDTVDDIILNTKPTVVDGHYLLQLKETTLPEHSFIDSVKLYAVSSGEKKDLNLVSAKHSRLGDVTSTLIESDDSRTDTKVFDSIELKFTAGEGDYFIFEIEGYNPGAWGYYKLDVTQISVIAVVAAVVILAIVFGVFKYFAKTKKK
jgi:hypothetical protein